ncbi:ABC transporter substrate-binding protein [Gracilibacillus massiliensis]|uniref:ABC transporter substrate-binding protein n=1 Tax=Gracilibacillus massiliensis TaxID=1564956 RepID=UPI00071CEF54|nr:ABC transporter substrate-binding protein [Gracilibacillus massiliensis]
MKNKKGYLKLLLSILISGAILVGCSSADEGEGDTSATEDQVTIDVFNYKVEMKDQFQTLVDQYTDENPDVEINVKTVGGGTNWESTLKTTFASGEEPDVFPVGGPSQVAEYRDSLADVSDTAAAEAALDGTLKSVIDGEEVLGLPFNQEGFGIIYNKSIFEAAGVNAEELLTFEDFENAFKKIDSQKSDLGIDAVFAFPGKEKWIMGNHIANAYLSPEFEGNIVNAYNADTVAFEKGDELKRFLDLKNEYAVQPVLSLDYSQQVEEYFSLGRVAMITQGNWVYPTINEMDSEFAENEIGILPLPMEGFEGKIPIDVPMYWGINKNSEDDVVQASKDFFDWMYTSEEGKQLVLEELKFMPAYEGYDVSKISDPISQELYEYSTEGNTIGWVYRGAPQGWHEETLGANMQKYLSGEMSWEELEEKSRKEWENARQ